MQYTRSPAAGCAHKKSGINRSQKIFNRNNERTKTGMITKLPITVNIPSISVRYTHAHDQKTSPIKKAL
jgi:hypothetical protein